MKNNFSYFQNKECEYFPCHEHAGAYFNCLFCYCPLYTLGDQCGGNFVFTEDGTKDCSNCLVPHGENGYSYILLKCKEVSALEKQNRGKGKPAPLL